MGRHTSSAGPQRGPGGTWRCCPALSGVAHALATQKCMMLKACCGATPMTPHICPGAQTVVPKTQNPPGSAHSHRTHCPGGRPRSPQDEGGHSRARTPAGRGLWEAGAGMPRSRFTNADSGPDPSRWSNSRTISSSMHRRSPSEGLLLNMASPAMGPSCCVWGLPLTVRPLLFLGLLSTAGSLPRPGPSNSQFFRCP